MRLILFFSPTSISLSVSLLAIRLCRLLIRMFYSKIILVIFMITIYKITNRLNGKIYVGQTRRKIERRFIEHSRAKTPLGNAMKNCGTENFTIEIIEECSTQEQANERERFWIKVLKCKIPNGYNQKDGGFVGYYRQQKVYRPMLKSLPKMNALDLLAKEKGLNFREKLLIGSIIDLPRPAREAVIDWAFKLIIAVEAQTTEEERKAQIHELERSIAEQQAKLDKLKGETSSYVEDTSTGVG